MDEWRLSAKERRLLRMALAEDGAHRDVTTSAMPRDFHWHGGLWAVQPGILAGLPVVAALFRLLDPRVRLKPRVREGVSFKRGRKVADVVGPVRALLSGERVALNLLSHLSGIATLTRAFVTRAGRPCVYDTRKTTPLWRSLERYAVRMGGGRNHRFNLSSHVLVKDNHRALCCGVWRAVEVSRRRAGPKAFLMAEVESEVQAREALKAGADALLFDNRTPHELKLLLKLVPRGIVTEASGGITLANVRAYARTGVQRISVGALTHSAHPVDFSLELDPIRKGRL